jgi:hypothetical protein
LNESILSGFRSQPPWSLADANMSLTEEQKRKVAQPYADQYEMEGRQIRSDGPPDLWSDGENLSMAQPAQADGASFLTPAQLELLRKKSDLDSERLRSVMDSMSKDRPAPKTFHETLVEC